MGIMVGLPSPSGSEKDLQLNFGKNMTVQVEMRAPHLPAEWHMQSDIQLTWPYVGTDWAYMLTEMQKRFINIAREIVKRESLPIVAPESEEVKKQVAATANTSSVRLLECTANDTWAHGHGAIIMIDTGTPSLPDFTFSGWELESAFELDNQIAKHAVEAGALKGQYIDHLDFIPEGGSIESDGMGILLTTSECLLFPQRNGRPNQVEMEEYLELTSHLQKVLWLDHDYLAGDSTDSHINTLARFCSTDAIAYVRRENKEDEHYEALLAMEEQPKTFRTLAGEPYRLLASPMADKMEEDDERLPVTYANFLIMNGAILYPTHNQSANDKKAGEVLQQVFPGHQIIGTDCHALTKQHGSLHCVTM